MELSKISALKILSVLLLSAGLLSGCKPIVEQKFKDPAATPAAKGTETVAAPATTINEVKSIESSEVSKANAEAVSKLDDATEPDLVVAINNGTQKQTVNDGADVVTATPEIIRGVQQALVNAGYNPGPVDGASGQKTVNAIQSFQKKNNLAVGKLTKETLRALNVPF
ncbi:MAG: peptidoglycan-binding domain-containing protein [Pseudomonadota bacterium]